MNILVTIVLLTMSVVALQYNAFVLFLALVISAVFASPEAWKYTLLTGLGILLLKHFYVPSWEVLSFLLIGLSYSLMSKLEEKKAPSVPPELLYYYMLGGGRGAP